MKKLIIFVTLSLLSFNVFAGFNEDDGYSEEPQVKNIYFSLALGYADNTYNDDNLNSIFDNDDFDRTPIFLDFSLYLPLNSNTLIGGSISGSADRLTYKSDDSYWVQLNTYLISASIQYFLTYVGEGLYFRADLGFTFGSASNSEGNGDSSENGTGFNLGLGYAFPLAPTTSITAMLMFSHKLIEELEVSTISISATVLF